jgi:moderate conductance mechanosensitive channel
MSWNDFVGWLGDNQAEILGRGLRIVGVLVAAFLLSRLLRRAVTRVENKVAQHTTPMRALQRTQTLTKVVSSAGIVVIWALALFYVLGELGFNLAPLLAGVGIVGLAVGFGAQNLVRDVVTGFFILLEDQYGVGDILQINQVASGQVEQLTLRVTGLRDLDGTMHYIANGNITHVANRSKDWARAVIDVGVGFTEEPGHVRSVLERVAREAKADPELGRSLYSEPSILGVERIAEYEVIWRMLADTKPARQWEVGRQLRERIKIAFDEAGIEIPFPHQVLVTPDGASSASKGT